MNDDRRRSPHLRPVQQEPKRQPLTIDRLRAAAWQRTLFAHGNPGLLAFVQLSESSESDFGDLIREGRATAVIDLRVAPTFDIGQLTRRAVFELFVRCGTKYFDTSGVLGISTARDARLNPSLISDYIKSLADRVRMDGPLVFLVEGIQFEDAYVTKLADELQELRPEGWDLLRVPASTSTPISDDPLIERKTLFISHANPEDNDFARWLGIQLSEQGYEVWSDVTKLVAGEKFWNSIEHVIRNEAAATIVVVSRVGQKKEGVLDEVNLAVTVERVRGLESFVIPVRIDDMPFSEVRANLARRNIVDFTDNWANGLSALLESLSKARIPRSSPNLRLLDAWTKAFSKPPQELIRVSENLTSNWLPIVEMPSQVAIAIGNSTSVGELSDLHTQSVRHSGGLVRFLQTGEPTRTGEAAFQLENFVRDGATEPVSISSRSAYLCVTQLLRSTWGRHALSLGLKPYCLASGAEAWYAPLGLIEGDKVRFRDDSGKYRRKHLLGRSEKRGVHWHLAVEARPAFGRANRYSLVSHIVFTTDGEVEFVSKKRMHRLRRQFCKNWWNDRWRDLLKAYVAWFTTSGAGENKAALGSAGVVVAQKLLTFKSPVMIRETTDELHYSEEVSNLEWEDLDSGDVDDESDGTDDDEV